MLGKIAEIDHILLRHKTRMPGDILEFADIARPRIPAQQGFEYAKGAHRAVAARAGISLATHWRIRDTIPPTAVQSAIEENG